MTTRSTTYPLRLPVSLRQAVEKLSEQDGTSINQFVVLAVAEKVAVMTTAEYFAKRRTRANLETFDRIMNRKGGEAPRPGDELPATRPNAAKSRASAKRIARRATSR